MTTPSTAAKSGTGTAPGTGTTTPPAGNPPAGNPEAGGDQTPPPQGAGTGEGNPDGELKFSQADLNRILAKEKEKLRTQTEEERERERRAAELKDLEKAQQFEELSKRQATELETLRRERDDLKATVEQLENVVDGVLSEEAKALTPEGAKALKSLPDSLSKYDKLAWLMKNRDSFLPKAPGTPPPPDTDAGRGRERRQTPARTDDDLRREKASSGKYVRF